MELNLSQDDLSVGREEDFVLLLRNSGLRPTKQRISLLKHIHAFGTRHLTAEELYQELIASGSAMSLATVYNNLNMLAEHGLLARIAVDGQRSWFDTNLEPHQHFYVEGEKKLIDIPHDELAVSLPHLPEGRTLDMVQVVVRIK